MDILKSIYTEEYKQLVSRLREARKEAKLTQQEVAVCLNVGQSFISKVESGQYRLDVVQLLRFAKLYGKDLSFFTS